MTTLAQSSLRTLGKRLTREHPPDMRDQQFPLQPLPIVPRCSFDSGFSYGLILTLTAAFLAASTLASTLHAQRISVDRRIPGATEVKMLLRSGVRDVPQGVDFVQLRAGEFLFARVGATATSTTTPEQIRWNLPLRLIGADGAGERINLRPVVEIEGGGLRLDPTTGQFVGRIQIGIEDEDDPTESRPLGRTVRILVTADADSTIPGSAAIDHTNLPFALLRIVAARPGDSIRIRVRPDFDPTGVQLQVPVVRPQLTIRASPTRIQGLGLETADLAVRLEGIAIEDSLAVTLSANRSRPEPSIVWINRSATATALIRSNGIGTDSVVAEGPWFRPAFARIEFLIPWAFTGAALLGGLVGGIIRYLWQKGKVSIGSLLLQILLGVLLGIVAAAAYAVGIRWRDVHPSATIGEAVVFVVAALGAWSSGRIAMRLTGTPTPNA